MKKLYDHITTPSTSATVTKSVIEINNNPSNINA